MSFATDDQPALFLKLKQLITDACHRTEDPQSIDDDEALIGPLSALGLDSLDVLQISVALTDCYAIRLEDSKQARRALRSIRSLAEFVVKNSPGAA
ncbi:MAG TPA: phosphopantetheine-binding protein [Acidiferrobacter sp.]|nr:phosphopantetheine-binding protein [Acidiferrobacter sp.]